MKNLGRSKLGLVGDLILVVLVGLLPACERPGLQSERAGPAGDLALQLTIAPDVEVDVATYRISGGTIMPITGTMMLGGPGPVLQLPPGTYTVELEARSRDGAVICRGASLFEVVAGASQDLTVTLDCRRFSGGNVSLNPLFNNCPVIDGRTASATSTPVDQPITVTVNASDGDPGTALLTSWRVTGGGDFADAAAASTLFHCRTAGSKQIEVTVTDGRCATTAALEVTCVPAPRCGDGVVDPGEGCEPPGTATCDATCQVIGADACAACLAVNCAETPGCGGLTEAARIPLCETLLACIARTGCRQGANNTPCLCGTTPVGQCTSEAGAANGPCLAEELAAAESIDLAVVSARFTNPTFASGAAHSFLSCRAESCAAECGSP